MLGAGSMPLLAEAAPGPTEADRSGATILVGSGVPWVRVKEAVLFPFDNYSVPFTWGLKLDLVMAKNPDARNPIVVRPGQPGEPDSETVRYYGTVIQVGDELRMWYLGGGGKSDPIPHLLPPLKGWHPLYAVSKDGINWEKPKLGLMEYNGNKQNNLLDFMDGKYGVGEHVVIYEPEDPDPARRFKMVFECGKYNNRLAVAFSPDGLRWTESPRNPVGPFLEESGLIKFNGCYYVNGQGGGQYGSGRKMVTFASYDFEHWSQACALSFRRGPIVDLGPDKWNTLEEVHLGASLTGRGNVIIGIYGMWHGDSTGDRSRVTMDLGLIVSNDALHFHEPIPDFRFIPAREELEVPPGRAALAQGQGMVNLGEKTLYWYEVWGSGDTTGVRMATWERDRFGYFRVFLPPDPGGRSPHPHFISCPIKLDRAGARVFINAVGLSENTELTVELLDLKFQGIPGYSGGDCIPIRTSGFRQAATWRGKEALEAFSHPVFVRVTFGGLRPEDAKLYAVYVASE